MIHIGTLRNSTFFMKNVIFLHFLRSYKIKVKFPEARIRRCDLSDGFFCFMPGQCACQVNLYISSDELEIRRDEILANKVYRVTLARDCLETIFANNTHLKLKVFVPQPDDLWQNLTKGCCIWKVSSDWCGHSRFQKGTNTYFTWHVRKENLGHVRLHLCYLIDGASQTKNNRFFRRKTALRTNAWTQEITIKAIKFLQWRRVIRSACSRVFFILFLLFWLRNHHHMTLMHLDLFD